jgi:processive 1,2-diacylglycerol beta-glucosyltransferase
VTLSQNFSSGLPSSLRKDIYTPFMSLPPKKILLLTAGFGEGHNTAARNVQQALLHVGGERVQVELLDVFAQAYGAYNEFTRKLYISAINKTPRLWQLFYNMLDRTRFFERSLFSFHKLEKKLGQLMAQEKPDLVCTTYPIYAFLFNRLYPDPQKRPFRLVNIVTDSISVNSLWYRTPSDEWLVPNTATAEVMAAAGLPQSCLHVFGFPVQLAFYLPEQKLSPPDPEREVPRILYLINSGKQQAPNTLRALLQSTQAHLTVSVGRDQSLQGVIEKISADYPGRVDLLGWTNQMPQMLMTHNLVITKAGGATVQEALASCCPLIINQIVPGQEEGNWELVRRIEGGVLAVTPQEVAHWAQKALAENAALAKQWRQNLQNVCRADSSILIARHLLDPAVATADKG